MGGNAKGGNNQRTFAGLDPIDVPDAQSAVPAPYFAGIAPLPASWLMDPIVSAVVNHTPKAPNPLSNPVFFADPTGGSESDKGAKYVVAKGKSAGRPNDVFASIAGELCSGQLDFIWGFLVNNNVAWPEAVMWNAKIYAQGKIVIYVPNGNAYKAITRTAIDPPAAPWGLFAVPWVAGAYLAGDQVIRSGFVFKARLNTSVAAPTTKITTADWDYVCTPANWSAGDHFWHANDIVAWKARLYITSADTKVEPPGAPWTLWKLDRATSTNPVKFTVPHNGDVYLYWGTPTQTLDVTGEAILANNGHPAYRNRPTVVLKNFLFGSQVNAPSITVLGGRLPVQTLITGAACDMDADWQVNPWCVLAEFLTHAIFGMGLPDARFDQASWQAEADRCAANPELYYISPMIDSTKTVREIIADLVSYPNGWICLSALGTLLAGHWPFNEAAPAFTAASTIDVHDLVEPMKGRSDLFQGTFNSIQLVFNDVQANFKANPVFVPNTFNQSIVRRLQPQRIERPYILRYNQAMAWAAEAAKIGGDQFATGEGLVCRAEKAASITPGSLFLLTDDLLATSQVQRCTGKTISPAPTGTVKLSHQTERGVSPQPYSPTAPNPAAPQGPLPERVQNASFIQIPAALAGGPNYLACLATRTNEFTSLFTVWFQQADATAFQPLANSGFGIAGKLIYSIEEPALVANDSFGAITQGFSYFNEPDIWNYDVKYNIGAGDVAAVEGTDYFLDPDAGSVFVIVGGGIPNGATLKISFSWLLYLDVEATTIAEDLESISSPLTEDEISDNTLLLFLIQPANPELFEICSIRSVTAIGGASYGFQIRRNRFGTLRGGDGTHIWTVDDLAFIIFKRNLTAVTHESFRGFQSTNSTAKFRLVPQSPSVNGDVADLFDLANNPQGLATDFDYTFNNVYAPTVTLVSAQNNGVDVAAWTATMDTTDVFKMLWNVIDKNNDLTKLDINIVCGTEERSVFSQNYEPSLQQDALFTFSFLKDGRWKFKITALDSSGNQSVTFFPSDGTSILVDHTGNVTGTPFVFAYETHGKKIKNLYLGSFTSNAFTVKFQLKNRGVAPDAQGAGGGAWTTCATITAVGGGNYKYGIVPPFDTRKKVLYAFAKVGAKANSATVEFNL